MLPPHLTLRSFRALFFSAGEYYHDSESVKAAYEMWVKQDLWVVMMREKEGEQATLEGGKVGTNALEWKAAKAAKRGNDVYIWKLKERLGPVERWIETGRHIWEGKESPLILHAPWDGRKRRGTGYAFLFTLTYARYEDGDERDPWEAWEDVGHDWNRFLSALRKRWGPKTQIMRCWEAHKDGWPHIHAVVLVPDGRPVFRYKKKWRLKEKKDLETLWPWGFMDVEAVKDPQGLKYVLKYVLKMYSPREGKKHIMTRALTWLFRKQSYSISRDWGLALDEIYRITMGIRIPFFPSELGGEEDDLIPPKEQFKPRWEFWGLVYAEDMQKICKWLKKEPKWTVEWVGDPPDRLKRWYENAKNM